MDEARPFPHTHGSQGGGLTHLRQTLPTRSSPALLPAPAWQQWFLLAFLPLDRDKEGAQGKISSIPPAIACQETGAPAGSPSWCDTAQAAPTIGCKLSPLARAGAFPSRVASQQTAAGLGEAPELRRCAGTTPPSLPRQDLATHRSWKVPHFLPDGGEGVPEPRSSS